MQLTVSSETLNETLRCERDFICLNNSGKCCRLDACKALHLDHEKMLHIEVDKVPSCSYFWLFGISQICTCPTRKKLFELYKL
jgi:hypothetical protein